MSKSWIRKFVYASLVATLLTFSATSVMFAQGLSQEEAPAATATVTEPAPDPTSTNTPVPAPTNTPVSVPTNTPTPDPAPPPVQIPEPITVVLFGSGLAALSASVAKRRKSQ